MTTLKPYHGNRQWLRFVFLFCNRYLSDDLGKSAAALTYYSIFTVFPLLIFITMLLGFLKLPPISLTSELGGFLPVDVISIINAGIVHVTKMRSSTLLVFGLFFSLYFPMRAVKCLMDSIHLIYGRKKRRSIQHQFVLLLLFTLFLVVTFLVTMGILIMGENLLHFFTQFIPLSLSSIFLWSRVRFVILAVLLFWLISSLYYVSPVDRPPKKYVFPGALFALFSWMIFCIGFSFYVNRLANYSVIYGSIGVVIVFLLWIYFSGLTILLGAEWNRTLMDMKEGMEG